MRAVKIRRFSPGLLLLAIIVASISCGRSAKNEVFFGRVVPPQTNILRYVNGDEPESLDPSVSSGQPEGRIYMALYEGLVEYHPKTLMPIPAIAEHWHENDDSSEFVFHLRHNARWSNGEPITANDFVYSIRRGLSPELAARNAYLAYYMKYAEAYNSGAVFVRDSKTNQFVLEKDIAGNPAQKTQPLSERVLAMVKLSISQLTKSRRLPTTRRSINSCIRPDDFLSQAMKKHAASRLHKTQNSSRQ